MNGIWFTENAYVDFNRVEVIYKDGKINSITENCFKLLTIFKENAGKVIPKGDIISEIWNINDNEDFCALDSLNHLLRQARILLVDDNKRHIRYVRAKKGYIFDPPEQREPPRLNFEKKLSIEKEERFMQSQLICGIKTLIEKQIRLTESLLKILDELTTDERTEVIKIYEKINNYYQSIVLSIEKKEGVYNGR